MTRQPEPSGEPRRVLLALNLARKGARDRFSGFLRYNLRTNWEINVLAFGSRYATPDVCAKRIRALRPDAVVYTDGAAPLLADALRAAKLRRRPFCVNFEHRTNLAALHPHGVVRLDDGAVVESAVETLARRGIAHFGFLSPHFSRANPHVVARVQAFRQATAARGGTCAVCVVETEARAPNVREIARWLAAIPKPCGVMLFNDAGALAAYAACRYAGLAIPDQVFFVGVDNDTMLCENMNPPLSSVQPDFERAGFLAAQLLDRCFANGRCERRCEVYGVRAVVERASTMDVSGASRYVFRAREYLQQHPDGRLTVTEVAAALNLSPRLLEKHFAKCAGRTLREELLDLRFARLRNLLATTNRPVNELIYLCGWRSVSSAKRLFKSRFGKSMRDCRTLKVPPDTPGREP